MSKKYKFLVLNGPNLNLLGIREKSIYGDFTLDDLIEKIYSNFDNRLDLVNFQSNSESDLIDRIHESHKSIDFIVINPAAYTHTSIAIRDALMAVSIPFIEVHISNIHKREAFRHNSYLSDIAVGVICGFGADGYVYAVESGINYLKNLEKR